MFSSRKPFPSRPPVFEGRGEAEPGRWQRALESLRWEGGEVTWLVWRWKGRRPSRKMRARLALPPPRAWPGGRAAEAGSRLTSSATLAGPVLLTRQAALTSPAASFVFLLERIGGS